MATTIDYIYLSADVCEISADRLRTNQINTVAFGSRPSMFSETVWRHAILFVHIKTNLLLILTFCGIQ